MFVYPFQLISITADPTLKAHAEIYINDVGFVPAIGSMVPFDLHEHCDHSIWKVIGYNDQNVVIACDYFAPYNMPTVARMAIDRAWFNLQETSIHDLEVTKYAHAFVNELSAAEKKHPHWNKDAVYAASIMSEESGETLQAALDYQQNPTDDIRLKRKISDEAIQTGAMALRLLINADGFEHDSKSFSVAEVDSLRKLVDDPDVNPAVVLQTLKELLAAKS